MESSVVSTKGLWKARRSAMKAKIYVPCVSCLAYRRKCSEVRPCSRCLRNSNECTRVYGTESVTLTAATRVDRPAISTNPVLELAPRDNFVPLNKYVVGISWGLQQLMKFSARGHPIDNLAKFLMSQYFTKNLVTISEVIQSSKKLADAIHTNTELKAVDNNFTASNSHMDGSESMWDINIDVGFVSISFDTVSGKRRRVLANPRMAQLLGMHNEEYLARTANRDLPFPYTALDSLLIFLYTSVRDSFPSSTPRELYARMHSGVGASRRGMLAVSRGLTVVNSSAQTSEVRCLAS